MNQTQGRVTGINANLVKVEFAGAVRQNEIAYLHQGKNRLKSEVIRIQGNQAEMQVFEDTRGLQVGDRASFTGELLSVELGPGLLGQIFDGLQNPLEVLAAKKGLFTPKGFEVPKLDQKKRWDYTPVAEMGQRLKGGQALGAVPEMAFVHQIFVPYSWQGAWELVWVARAGAYSLKEPIARLKNSQGQEREAFLSFSWPVKRPIQAFKQRLRPTEPMITQIRLIDCFFPVAKGGTYCIPGPFGAGKTVLQQLTSRYAGVDVVLIAACGERANEVVETIKEFPLLKDPKRGTSLMERTIIICNTSSMPVAARESSVYTAVTLAEHYRQMGLDVLLLADSTSRWAQALRERSGRLEEIPGEEAFPAYLESVIAAFYERAGRVELENDQTGSVTIGGTVSPAGGNFEEPVTKATLKVVGAFHALSRERSDARKFPAIHPLESWTRYQGILPGSEREEILSLLRRAQVVEEMMKVVGEEGTSLEDFILYLKGEFFEQVFLQQNAFDLVDAATSQERQIYGIQLAQEVLQAKFAFQTKDPARSLFHRLRQAFVDYNSTPWEKEKIEPLVERIGGLIDEGVGNEGEI